MNTLRFIPAAVLALSSFAHADDPAPSWSATIDNPYLPLSKVPLTALEKKGKTVQRVERRVAEKTEKVGDVECLVLVETETIDGKPHEITKNFFAQKGGAVWCFGEKVDNYKDGKVSSHTGSWMVGDDAKEPTLFIPAAPKAGEKFTMEDVKDKAEEAAEVLSVTEKIDANGTTYEDVVEIKATDLRTKEEEFSWYAKGVGLIQLQEGKHPLVLVQVGEAKKPEEGKEEGSGK